MLECDAELDERAVFFHPAAVIDRVRNKLVDLGLLRKVTPTSACGLIDLRQRRLGSKRLPTQSEPASSLRSMRVSCGLAFLTNQSAGARLLANQGALPVDRQRVLHGEQLQPRHPPRFRKTHRWQG
jgi:hypothetical protein